MIKAACIRHNVDAWEIMSKAMASVTSGEAWVVKNTPGHDGGRYWNMEYAILSQNRVLASQSRGPPKEIRQKDVMDVFPSNGRDEIAVICGTTDDPWEVMLKAMEMIASGDTWVLKDTVGHARGTY